MSDEVQMKFYGVAIMGLLYISFGIVMLFAFVSVMAGVALPDFLVFNSESYNYLLIGLVNLAAAVGILYRSQSMWSITMVFDAVILIGSLMDIFFTGNAKIAVFVLYLAALMFMMSKEARVWYNVK